MLLELLVSTTIVLALLGTVFGLLHPARGAVGAQPQAAEMQQRLRAAITRIHGDLLMAGSGPHPRADTTVAWLRAAVVPARLGRGSSPAAATTFRADALSILYAPSHDAGAVLAAPLSGSSARAWLGPAPGCRRPPRCGLNTGEGGLALVFDQHGRSDLLRITRARGDTVWLRHVGAGPSLPYAAGASIVPLRVRSYYRDGAANQLRYRDGWTTDLPFVDNVVGLSVRYFGGPLPAVVDADLTLPSAPEGRAIAPCLRAAHAAGSVAAARLSVTELSPTIFTDGPWCGGGLPFDVDLFRVRRVRVEIRLQVAGAAWRGGDPMLFARPGGRIPDLVASVDVAPRSLGSW